jgi:hypothetical protein
MVFLKVVSTFPVFPVIASSGLISSDIAAIHCLGPSLPFCLHGVSVLSTSLAQPWPWSTYSWRCFSCAMPLLHGGTPSCRWQPTFSGIHNFLESVPLALSFALQLDAGPCATSSLFKMILLRPLP